MAVARLAWLKRWISLSVIALLAVLVGGACVYANAGDAYVEHVEITSGWSCVAGDYIRVRAQLAGTFYLAVPEMYSWLPNYGIDGFIITYEATVWEITNNGWLGASRTKLDTVTFEHEFHSLASDYACVYIGEECGYGPFTWEGVDEAGECKYCSSRGPDWKRLSALRDVRVLKVTEDLNGRTLCVSVRARFSPTSPTILPGAEGIAGFGWLLSKEWTNTRTSAPVTVALQSAPAPEVADFSVAASSSQQMPPEKGDTLRVSALVRNHGGYSWKTWLALSLSPGLEYVPDSFSASDPTNDSATDELLEYKAGGAVQDRDGQRITASYDLLDIEMLGLLPQSTRQVFLTLRVTEAAPQWIKYRLTSRAGLPDERLWSFESSSINDTDQQGWPAVRLDIPIAEETSNTAENKNGGLPRESDATPPVVEWERVVEGGVGPIEPEAIAATADGGLVVAGTCFVRTTTESHPHLVKFNARGEVVWERLLREQDAGCFREVEPTADGGCILRTTTLLAKFDAAGCQQWARTGWPVPGIVSLTGLRSGGLALLKKDLHEKNDMQRGCRLLFADATGEIAERPLLYLDDDNIGPFIQTSDGLFLFLGTKWAGHDSSPAAVDPVISGVVWQPYLALMAPDRAQMRGEWSQPFERVTCHLRYGSDTCCHPGQLLEASDGGFFFTAGAHRQEGEFPERVLLVKTSQHGDMLWQREFWGLFTKWIVSDIWATGDGGLIAVGTRESLGDRNAWVTKIGANGEQEWELLLGNESSSEQGLGVRPTQDGGFVVVGEKLYSNRSHLWLIKLAG